MADPKIGRRAFVAGSAAAILAAPAIAQTAAPQTSAATTEMEGAISQSVRRNISAFRELDWRPYFANLNNGVILCDIQSARPPLLERGRVDLPPLSHFCASDR